MVPDRTQMRIDAMEVSGMVSATRTGDLRSGDGWNSEDAKQCLNTGERRTTMTKKTMKERYAQLGAGLTLHDDLETHSKPEEEIKRANGGQADQQQVEEQQSEQEGKPPVTDGCGSAGDDVSDTTDGDGLAS
jgi:hypothetical protein